MRYCNECHNTPLYVKEYMRGVCGHCAEQQRTNKMLCTANSNNEVSTIIPASTELWYLIENMGDKDVALNTPMWLKFARMDGV
jgi:hypothetical protein